MKNFFEKDKEDKNFKYFKKEYRPDIDWREIFSIFSFLIVALLLISGYLFFQIQNDAIFEVEETTSLELRKIDKSKLSSVLEMIEQKKQNIENITY